MIVSITSLAGRERGAYFIHAKYPYTRSNPWFVMLLNVNLLEDWIRRRTVFSTVVSEELYI